MLQVSRTHVAKLPNSESVFSGLAYARKRDQAFQVSHGAAERPPAAVVFRPSWPSYLSSSALIAKQVSRWAANQAVGCQAAVLAAPVVAGHLGRLAHLRVVAIRDRILLLDRISTSYREGNPIH
jgi:hypothetical protein